MHQPALGQAAKRRNGQFGSLRPAGQLQPTFSKPASRRYDLCCPYACGAGVEQVA